MICEAHPHKKRGWRCASEIIHILTFCNIFRNYAHILYRVSSIMPHLISRNLSYCQTILYERVCSTVGVFSTMEDIMINVGDILSTMRGVQYHGGYHKYRGWLSWVPWEYSVPWGVSWCTWGDIMSTVGEKSFVIWVPLRYGTPSTVLMISPHMYHNIPHGTHDIPHVHHDIPTVLSIPHGTKTTPTVLMISPTVLNTPTVLKIYHDIPLQYWTSPRYSRYSPTCIMISPTVLQTRYTGWNCVLFVKVIARTKQLIGKILWILRQMAIVFAIVFCWLIHEQNLLLIG